MTEVAEEEKDRKPPSEIEIKADGEESGDGIGVVNDDVTFDLVQHNSDQGVIHFEVCQRAAQDASRSQKFVKITQRGAGRRDEVRICSYRA